MKETLRDSKKTKRKGAPSSKSVEGDRAGLHHAGAENSPVFKVEKGVR